MEPEWGPARTPAAIRLWVAVVPALTSALRERSGEISIAMASRIATEIPELLADADATEANRASNEANILLVADLLERGADPHAVALPPPTFAYAVESAHQDTPLPGLMRAYRIGHAYMWEQILGLLRGQIADPGTFAEAVDLISAWLHAFVDAAVCLAEDVYTQERERWLRSSSALRAETIREILAGVPTDPAAASLRLGYELERTHLGLVAWLERDGSEPDPIGAIEAALSRAASRLDAGRALIQPTGLATSVAWIGFRGDLTPSAVTVIDDDAEGRHGVRLGVGEPGHGIDGFRRTHREAMQARRIATLAGHPPSSVTHYPAVALAAIATVDAEQAGTFVQRRLGPLASRDETSLRLLATLRAFLDEGASHGRSANRLGIHENTVRYRIRQAEDLLGRPVGPGDLELRVAIDLYLTSPALGEPGLGDAPSGEFRD